MLSQKTQDDLMTAYHKVYEEKRGHAAGDSDVEKQASQLASDVKYKAKGKVKEGASEEADYFYSLVTNAERTGLIDKLNDGIYKLSHEVDANDKKGSIRYRNVAGTMDIVELSGEYSGEGYDLLKVEIEATGAYGTGTFKVHYFSNDQLFGATTSAEKITGGLQYIHNGLYGRFQGASATDGDIWEIEVYGSHRKQTNKSNATIEMVR